MLSWSQEIGTPEISSGSNTFFVLPFLNFVLKVIVAPPSTVPENWRVAAEAVDDTSRAPVKQMQTSTRFATFIPNTSQSLLPSS